MTREQFQSLADAYGGEIARWPPDVRDQAGLLAATHPAFAQAVLTQASRLDAALDALPRATASRMLLDRIVASAPAAPRRRNWLSWLLPAGAGAALAGATAAGLVMGVQLSQASAVSAEASAQAVADLDVSGLAGEG